MGGAASPASCLRVGLGIAGKWLGSGEFRVSRCRFECPVPASGGKGAARGCLCGVPTVIQVGAAGERSVCARISHAVATTDLIRANFARDSDDLCGCG